MTRFSGTAKRLVLPVLLAGTLIAVQVVLAAPPQASFMVSGPSPGGCGTFTFTSTATDGDEDITNTEWDFDYGGLGTFNTDDSGSPVMHRYPTPGPRTVALRVIDAAGGDDTTVDESIAEQVVSVPSIGGPSASIVPTPAEAQIGQTVSFSAAGSTDPDGPGTIASYQWDLDGTPGFELTTTTPTTSRSYATAGTRTVRVRVTDNCGLPGAESASVSVVNAEPSASFTATPNPAQPGDTVNFDASASSDPGGSITNYAWDLDGDGSFETDSDADPTVEKVYTGSGLVVVQLQVTDSGGATKTTFRQLRINAAPAASFTATPNPALIGEAVTFNGSASGDSDGTITTYEWDYDYDGTNFQVDATGVTPLPHGFNTAGTFNVALRVTDNTGAKDIEARPVTVQVTRPNASLKFTPPWPLPGKTVTLTSTSTPSATPGAPQLVSTQWDLNYQPTAEFNVDAAGTVVSTSFASPGPHTIAIKVSETGGGFAIAYDTILVNAPPRASFDVAPDDPVEGNQVTFASTSVDPDGPLVKQEWDLDGDNQFDDAAGAVASTRKLKKGPHTVRLRVTDSRGATAIAQQPVTVDPKPLKPPPDVGKSFYYTPAKWGIKLAVLVVKVPSRTEVTVKCKGRGCPSGTFRKSSKKKPARLRFKQVKGSLRAGAKITVMSTRPGHIGQHVTYTVRGKYRQPTKRERCFRTNPKKLRACPSS